MTILIVFEWLSFFSCVWTAFYWVMFEQPSIFYYVWTAFYWV